MTYEEAIAYIHGMYWRGSKLGLVRVTELCELLGNPQNKLKFIHVAGTNGKGSTCAMLSRILCAQGYRTGLFVSPYVDRFNERIQFNNEPIADDELAEIITDLKPVVESMENAPTEFEVITAAAFLYYVRKQCDYVVLEVGLGGEVRPVNQLDARVNEAARLGFRRAVVPAANPCAARGIALAPVNKIDDALALLQK